MSVCVCLSVCSSEFIAFESRMTILAIPVSNLYGQYKHWCRANFWGGCDAASFEVALSFMRR
jgi:hypothetical protein